MAHQYEEQVRIDRESLFRRWHITQKQSQTSQAITDDIANRRQHSQSWTAIFIVLKKRLHLVGSGVRCFYYDRNGY